MEISVGTVLGIAGVCIVLMVIEYILILGPGFAELPGLKRWIKWVCLIVLWIMNLIAVGIMILCCMAAFDYWKAGNTQTALKLVITAVIVLISLYILSFRYYIKKIFKNKRK